MTTIISQFLVPLFAAALGGLVVAAYRDRNLFIAIAMPLSRALLLAMVFQFGWICAVLASRIYLSRQIANQGEAGPDALLALYPPYWLIVLSGTVFAVTGLGIAIVKHRARNDASLPHAE